MRPFASGNATINRHRGYCESHEVFAVDGNNELVQLRLKQLVSARCRQITEIYHRNALRHPAASASSGVQNHRLPPPISILIGLLSWVTKSMARHDNYVVSVRLALMSYAMLGRTADAQMMRARLHQLGADMTISQLEKYLPYQRREDVEAYLEAYRLAGMPE
jgi:hypothetical protein